MEVGNEDLREIRTVVAAVLKPCVVTGASTVRPFRKKKTGQPPTIKICLPAAPDSLFGAKISCHNIVGEKGWKENAVNFSLGPNRLRTMMANNHQEEASGMFDVDSNRVSVDDKDWALEVLDRGANQNSLYRISPSPSIDRSIETLG